MYLSLFCLLASISLRITWAILAPEMSTVCLCVAMMVSPLIETLTEFSTGSLAVLICKSPPKVGSG